MLTRIYYHFKMAEKRQNKLLAKQQSKTLTALEIEYEQLVKLSFEALSDMKSADHFFNNAEPIFMEKEHKSSYIDVAILNKEAMQMRYCLLFKEAKQLRAQIIKLKNLKEVV